jgi:hypothetical protein
MWTVKAVTVLENSILGPGLVADINKYVHGETYSCLDDYQQLPLLLRKSIVR